MRNAESKERIVAADDSPSPASCRLNEVRSQSSRLESSGREKRLRFATTLVFALIWNAGCDSQQQRSAPTADVKGIVNIDGKPLPTGEIHFGATGVPPSVLEIKEGAYSGKAPVGKNLVEVFVYVDGPPSQKYGETRERINTTPARFWGPKTILSATVNAGVTNEFQHDIGSK